MSGPALAIMTRAPAPGQAKTRLQPFLTREQSADLALAFLRDALELVMSVKACVPFLAFTPPDMEAFFRQLVSSRVGLLDQGEGDLGQKMYSVFQQLCDRGYSSIVVVGSDIPTLQPDHLERAIECLRDNEVCLGPSRDGGYYLIGAQGAHRGLFEGVSWSTPRVLQDTMDRAKAAGLSLALLETCSDVDTVDDLRRLRLDLERLEQMPEARVPRHTKACLKSISL
ncbi:MAG: TIGR04282 family arsenosugar biosynthesis glycosyltransferase [Chloroflexi bacterium]|nr:TIGR04282 family arsenosugar biosynthesis glycosyltransferase [Chloroflexota bacterium]